jgi:hypothetical protein
MTYVIGEPCIDENDRSCIDVCPVDCIHEAAIVQGPAAVEAALEGHLA